MPIEFPPDTRFDKPGLHSLIDLLNQTTKLYFGYDEIGIAEVVALTATPDMIENAQVTLQHLIDGEETDGVATLRYRRLDIAVYLEESDHALTMENITDPSVEEILAAIKEQYKIHLVPAEVDIEIADTLNADGSHTVSVDINDGHPVWFGNVEFFMTA